MFCESRSHLTASGETYLEHMRFAMTVGTMAIGAGLACVLHAVIPGLCQTSCSRTVADLQGLFADRQRLVEIAERSSGVTVFVGLTAISSMTAAFALIVGVGSPFAWAAALPSVALPMLYVAQNPALDPI